MSVCVCVCIVFVFVFWVCVLCIAIVFFFKQKTADDMRISDWSSDVCSSDLCCLLDLLDGVFELVLLLFDLSDNSSDAAWIIDDARRRKERRTRPDLRESDGREGARDRKSTRLNSSH